jgi:hypothetical protein
MTKSIVGAFALDTLRNVRNWLRNPTRFVQLDQKRPSEASIRYLASRLGRHRPVGLTHRPGVLYHELPFPGLRMDVSRGDLSERVRRITSALSVEGKFGIDIGCAVGGVTFSLQQAGARMVGVDRDLPSLQVARECEALYGTGAIFVHREVSIETFEDLADRMANPANKCFDFVVWLSSMNWVASSLGPKEFEKLLDKVSKRSDVLIADSALGGKASASMEAMGIRTNQDFSTFVLAHSHFVSATVLGVDDTWYGRELFLFRK